MHVELSELFELFEPSIAPVGPASPLAATSEAGSSALGEQALGAANIRRMGATARREYNGVTA